MQLAPGQVLHHRYEIVGPLGEGGLGRSYRARDRARDEDVVLKVVRAGTALLGEALKDEFTRLRGIVHPNLTEVRDFGFLGGEDRFAFYTCAFVDATPLDRWAPGRSWAELVGPVGDALEGLRALHNLGIVHGDFKPANVLVERGSHRGVLIDLSCSQLTGEPADSPSGTPGYVAPERIAGDRLDARADLHGVGATLLRLGMVGRDGVPEAVTALAERLSRKDPADRPSDVAEVLEILGRKRAGDPLVLAQPPRLIGREAELSLFEILLARLIEGGEGERVLLLVGGDGMGSTRLLEEMKWRAQVRCAVVESEATRPEPLRRLLQTLAGEPDAGPAANLSGVACVIEARERLRRSPRRPCLIVLDDADRLEASDRDLWIALLRSVERDDPVLVLAATKGAVPEHLDPSVVRTCSLAPLPPGDVARWMEPLPAGARPEEALRLTGGSPAMLRELSRWLAAGGPIEGFVAGPEGATRRRLDAIASLSEGRRWALALLAAKGSPADPAWLAAEGAGLADIGALLGFGWAIVEGGAVRMARLAEAPTVLSAIGGELALRALSRVARWWSERRSAAADDTLRSTCAARQALCLQRAGAVAEAEELLRTEKSSQEACPDPWVDVAIALGRPIRDPALTLAAASILEWAGRPEQALGLLAALLRTRPTAAVVAAARMQAGGCTLRAGRGKKAVSRLRRAVAQMPRLAPERGRALDLLSRALIQTGQYEDAAQAAGEAIEHAEDDAVCADLHDDLGVALGYLGRIDEARRHLREASALHAAAGRPRALARSASYRALLDYRAGDTVAAAHGFRRALELSERSGGADLCMYAAQNLAVVSHQQGDLGRALAAYQRSLRMATAMGEAAAEVTARANLAKLYTDVGQIDRAQHTAERAEAEARRGGFELAASSALQVRAEVALLRGLPEEALALAREAVRESSEDKTLRELAEAQLLAGEAELALAHAGAARGLADEAGRLAAEMDARDLCARAGTLRGRVALSEGDSETALRILEEAREMVARLGQAWVSADIERELADVHRRRGATGAAARHAAAAVAHWKKMAGSLPREYADAFWAHPRHRCDEPTRAAPVDSSVGRELQLERLLEINRRLSASLEPGVLLGYAIDSALEITGAERGFVILRRGGAASGDLEIAATRNLAGIPDEETTFSVGIAERVIATGQAVVSGDLRHDLRFATRHSAHAKEIESALGTPIRLADRIIGALYLDHRTRRGLFDDEAVRMLGAFADQVAIALGNSRLLQELAERTRELDRVRKRIERLLDGQAVRIDELTEQVREQQRHLEHRYDYAHIVGKSRAMRQLFARLDRVIETSAPLLIEGESGTGKELVAKAIHYNGARKERPLVALNCAAVPETLLEAELFGYRKGAFTGAVTDRDGLFVSARGGTVFLDEVGEMPASMQVKLLRVLQEHRVRPLGATHTVPVEYRLVCATNRRLRDEVAAGRFREDLFYRVGVVEIWVPPLRDRLEDLPDLVDRILSTAGGSGSTPARVSKAAMRALLEYSWPGNVRQLENVITKAALLAPGHEIGPDDLDLPQGSPAPGAIGRAQFEDQESSKMLAMLRSCRWNVTEAARQMGIPRATFYRKMRRYGLGSGR